jgi:hypothetical protein
MLSCIVALSEYLELAVEPLDGLAVFTPPAIAVAERAVQVIDPGDVEVAAVPSVRVLASVDGCAARIDVHLSVILKGRVARERAQEGELCRVVREDPNGADTTETGRDRLGKLDTGRRKHRVQFRGRRLGTLDHDGRDGRARRA